MNTEPQMTNETIVEEEHIKPKRQKLKWWICKCHRLNANKDLCSKCGDKRAN